MSSEALKDAKILIVDDQQTNLDLLATILELAGYRNRHCTSDPREVLGLYRSYQPDVLLLDLHMPHLEGSEVIKQLRREFDQEASCPVVVLTADTRAETKHRALSLGARDFLTKPIDATEVLLRIRNLLEVRMLHLQLKEQNQTLENRVRDRTKALEDAQFEVLKRLALVAEYHDDETGQHTQRVGSLSALLSQALGDSEDDVELIRQAAPLHDIGKIGISDRLLLKPGRLDHDEFEVVKRHTTIGAQMLADSSNVFLQLAEQIALTHHERWDGLGYPHGLCAGEIPQAGRIVAVADVFDALTHERPYKKAWPVEQAVEEIGRQRGAQFDPDVVDAFLSLMSGGELRKLSIEIEEHEALAQEDAPSRQMEAQ